MSVARHFLQRPRRGLPPPPRPHHPPRGEVAVETPVEAPVEAPVEDSAGVPMIVNESPVPSVVEEEVAASHVVEEETVASSVVEEETVASSVVEEETVAPPVVEEEAVAPPVVQVEAVTGLPWATEESENPVSERWDMLMKKADLLAVAGRLGVVTDDAMTKAQIIAALDAYAKPA